MEICSLWATVLTVKRPVFYVHVSLLYISSPVLIMLTLPLLCLSIKVIAYPPPICNGGIGGKTQPFFNVTPTSSLTSSHYREWKVILPNACRDSLICGFHVHDLIYVMNCAPNVICLSFYSLSHYCNCTLPSLIILTLLGKQPKMIQRL